LWFYKYLTVIATFDIR